MARLTSPPARRASPCQIRAPSPAPRSGPRAFPPPRAPARCGPSRAHTCTGWLCRGASRGWLQSNNTLRRSAAGRPARRTCNLKPYWLGAHVAGQNGQQGWHRQRALWAGARCDRGRRRCRQSQPPPWAPCHQALQVLRCLCQVVGRLPDRCCELEVGLGVFPRDGQARQKSLAKLGGQRANCQTST